MPEPEADISKEMGEANEVLEDIPTEVIQKTQTMMAIFGRMNSSPLADKVTGEHITRDQEIREKSIAFQHKETQTRHLLLFAGSVVAAILVVVILVLFRDNPNLIEKILYAAGGVLAGGIGGYGYGKSKRD
ncbi:MAG: hypothetical protein LBB50_02540 [Oscillospiraceae bacterium]|jgi:ribosomal protein L9|nr:hypothetical protein [Oscillospiraceae bacterium]